MPSLFDTACPPTEAETVMSSDSPKATASLRLLELPPFPSVAIRALQLVSKSDTRLYELHELISSDPVFSSELLKLANSPLYGIRTEIHSTMQATILLGFERVKALALTIGIRSYLGASPQTLVLRSCWTHSLACAIAAEEIAGAGFVDKDVAYTAGLIHDIGRIALAFLDPERYAALVEDASTDADLLSLERELFAVDHCEAGRFLLESWKLPSIFCEIVSRHHESAQGSAFDLLAVVKLGCAISDALEFGLRPVGSPAYQQLLAELPDYVRNRIRGTPEEIAARITSKIRCYESTQGTGVSPPFQSSNPFIISVPSR